eukprot:192877-Chlamydomonas_euryale.AAC.1
MFDGGMQPHVSRMDAAARLTDGRSRMFGGGMQPHVSRRDAAACDTNVRERGGTCDTNVREGGITCRDDPVDRAPVAGWKLGHRRIWREAAGTQMERMTEGFRIKAVRIVSARQL